METLPMELFLKVTVDFSPQEFRRLRPTSKRFCAFAQRAAFREMKVVNTLPSVQGFFQLLHEQSVCDCIEVVEFVEGDEVGDASLFEHITKAFTDLYLASNFQQLTLKFNVKYGAEGYMSKSSRSPSLQLQCAVIAGLAASQPIESLRSWIVTGFLPFDNPYWKRLSPLLQPLHHLDLEMICYRNKGGFKDEDMNLFFDVLNEEILPACGSLRSLALRPKGARMGVLPLIDFYDLWYPALTSLFLENFIFYWHGALAEPGQPLLIGGAEDFIASHGRTLKSLTLLNCGGLVAGAGYTMQSIFRLTPPTRYWSEIWPRFSTELSALTELDVEFMNSRGKTYRYFREDYQFGSIGSWGGLTSDAPDVSAFLEFKAVVDNRRAGQV